MLQSLQFCQWIRPISEVKMRLKIFLTVSAFLAIAEAIPMDFRKEVPADEIIVPMADDGISYRLPNNTVPISYDITLTTDVHIGKPEFIGKVVIVVKALENTHEITMHHRQTLIESVKLSTATETPVEIIDVTFASKDDTEFLVISSPTTQLDEGSEYIVEIIYNGLLRDDNMGFYRSSYKNAEGKLIWLATTQFEQTDARHAFPCYDEPQIRAKHTIHIKHDKSYKAISNMPEEVPVEEPETDYVITSFATTEPVQTYLVAFIISDFYSIENNDNKKQRVFAKGQSIVNKEADLALEAGKAILEKFVEHLGVEYKLPKMDQVAVPDFDAGAMENW